MQKDGGGGGHRAVGDEIDKLRKAFWTFGSRTQIILLIKTV